MGHFGLRPSCSDRIRLLGRKLCLCRQPGKGPEVQDPFFLPDAGRLPSSFRCFWEWSNPDGLRCRMDLAVQIRRLYLLPALFRASPDDHGEIGRSLLGGPTLLAGMGQAILPDYVIKPSLPQPQRNKILFGPEEVATSYEFLDTSMCISGPRLWQLTPILHCLRLPDAARSST